MNTRHSYLMMVVCGLLIVGCKGRTEPPKPPPPQSKPQGTVFDGIVSQKDRAQKGVDDASEKNRLNLEEAMKKAELHESAE